jgi:hypothetical protein
MAVGASFADLRSQVDDLAQLGLTERERDRLLNEGHAELCVRSEWTKEIIEVGPAVAGQEVYDLPATIRKPLSVTVGGTPYVNTDEATVSSVDSRFQRQSAAGMWWIAYSGGRRLGVRPAPTGSSIALSAIVYPDEMTDDEDEPVIPPDFRQGIVDYVTAIALGGGEDSIDDRQAATEEFERQVVRLRALGITYESGEGPAQIQVKGVHF